MSNDSRKPKGSPGGTGGEYDRRRGGGSGLPPIDLGDDRSKRHRQALFDDLDRRKRGWRYDEALLGATEGRHRGEKVAGVAFEMREVDRQIGEPGRPGRATLSFMRFTGDENQAAELARIYMEERMTSLRQNTAVHADRCYSEALVVRALNEPIRVERLFAREPWHLSAHKMRVGMRYRAAVEKARRDGTPPAATGRDRDRIWDDTLAAFLDEKIASGASYGSGYRYSDGTNADPKAKDHTKVRKVKGTDMPFNGRKDFEVMLGEGMARFRDGSLDSMMGLGFDPAY